MKNKLMLLVAGAFAALAFAALPAVASAGTFTADCETGATCSATISGGATQLINTNGEGIECTSSGGSASITSGTSTGSATIIFKGCRENITFFHFTCSNTGTSGEIKSNTLTSDLIYLNDNKTGAKGILLTGVNTTFTCAGFSDKTVTGNVIGEIENPNCGTFQASHLINFAQSSNGHQKWKQITETGTIYDLISNNDTKEGAYLTSSQIGTGKLTYTSNRVKLTC